MIDVPGGGVARDPKGGVEKWGRGKLATPSPRAPIVLGVDPGGRWTGLAGRQGDWPVWTDLVTREGRAAIPEQDYLAGVIDAIERALDALGEIEGGDVILAVESMVAPKGYRITSAAGLLGPAMVLGAILGWFDSPLLVPPGGHGKGPPEAYPETFWGRQEKKGTGKLRHVRSAWDIAAAGLVLAREI